jgi:hypothetical protein
MSLILVPRFCEAVAQLWKDVLIVAGRLNGLAGIGVALREKVTMRLGGVRGG